MPSMQVPKLDAQHPQPVGTKGTPLGTAAGWRYPGTPGEQDVTDASCGEVRVQPSPCSLGSWGKNTALGSCPLQGLGFNPWVAGTVLALPMAVATALVHAIGELAEFVLQVGDALLLRLDRLLQGTDLLQNLL